MKVCRITIELPNDLVIAIQAKADSEGRDFNEVAIESLRIGLELPLPID
jgi:hypothetical protein